MLLNNLRVWVWMLWCSSDTYVVLTCNYYACKKHMPCRTKLPSVIKAPIHSRCIYCITQDVVAEFLYDYEVIWNARKSASAYTAITCIFLFLKSWWKDGTQAKIEPITFWCTSDIGADFSSSSSLTLRDRTVFLQLSQGIMLWFWWKKNQAFSVDWYLWSLIDVKGTVWASSEVSALFVIYMDVQTHQR